MKLKIAILRGINVGGKRKILMADLREICAGLGWENIETYIQSGNIVFSSNREAKDLEKELEKAILQEYGFDVPVIVKYAEELKFIAEHNPYVKKKTEIKHLFLTFLKEVPTDENMLIVNEVDASPDELIVKDSFVFIYCEGKYHKSKLTNNFFEKKLKVKATTRNWKTVLKLLELSGN